MRYEEPKTQDGANGYFGGVGSKPGVEPWTPGGRRRRSAREWVPARLRRLRIRRTRWRPTDSDRTTMGPAVLVMGLVVFLLLVRFSILSL